MQSKSVLWNQHNKECYVEDEWAVLLKQATFPLVLLKIEVENHHEEKENLSPKPVTLEKHNSVKRMNNCLIWLVICNQNSTCKGSKGAMRS